MTTLVHFPVGQFARFVVVGTGNTLISFIAYSPLVALSFPAPLAAGVAFGVGAVNGYVLNRRWTFSAPDTRRARLIYVCVQAAGALATALLVWLAVNEAAVGHVAAYVVAVPPVTTAGFLANRLWTFADRN